MHVEKAMQLLTVRAHMGLLSNGNVHPFLPGLVISKELSLGLCMAYMIY